jgi:hypothetical protein
MFHTFCHTCASLLFEAARDVKQVAEWLGDAARSFTRRTYVHLMDRASVTPHLWTTSSLRFPLAAHRKLRTTVAFRPKRRFQKPLAWTDDFPVERDDEYNREVERVQSRYEAIEHRAEELHVA